MFYFGSIDYKSIALPAEQQGHSLINQVFSLKDQLNQSIISKLKIVSFKSLKKYINSKVYFN